MDTVAFHLVTMGSRASQYSQELFKADNYAEYLYFHGLSVESAEALAELWHKRIREELAIAQDDAEDVRKLFRQQYQGSRFSFGYPACPNLEDQTKLFELLDPSRIGVELTEEFQLEPEQSTSAIISHHPEAKYFAVDRSSSPKSNVQSRKSRAESCCRGRDYASQIRARTFDIGQWTVSRPLPR